MRGGFKVFARNFASGAFLLGLIEGFNIMLSSYPKGSYKLSVRMHNVKDRTIELGMQDEYRNSDGSYYVTDVEII